MGTLNLNCCCLLPALVSVITGSHCYFYRTTALATKLTEFNLGSDKHTFLSKLIKSIFSSYLESYIDMEKEYLRTRGAMILQRYYDSKNHQKRPIGTGRWAMILHILRMLCGLGLTRSLYVLLQYPGYKGADQTAHQSPPRPQHWHPRRDLSVPRAGGQPLTGNASCFWEMP